MRATVSAEEIAKRKLTLHEKQNEIYKPTADDSSVMLFELRFSLFKLGKEYKASGTRGSAFKERSTSERLVRLSRLLGIFCKVLMVERI